MYCTPRSNKSQGGNVEPDYFEVLESLKRLVVEGVAIRDQVGDPFNRELIRAEQVLLRVPGGKTQ